MPVHSKALYVHFKRTSPQHRYWRANSKEFQSYSHRSLKVFQSGGFSFKNSSMKLRGDIANFNVGGGDSELHDINTEALNEIFSKCFPTLPHHKFGSIVYLGTGGSVDRINECKEIFTNPDLYPITPYWEDAKKINKMSDIIVD